MNQKLKTILTILMLVAAFPVVFFMLTQAWYYATCPVYTFEEPQPFSGSRLYNPYAGLGSEHWKKTIFHMHTKSWMGLTNGENSREEMIKVYKSLRYDVLAFSNYMKVDKGHADSPGYIPCYEHGYSYGKTHQLAMGSHGRILWRDYAYIQNLNQKQYTLDLLKQRSEVVAINHPDLRYGYTPEDFKYMCNYDLFEVLNGARHSFVHWDSALSHGHTAWLTANDDSHGVSDLSKVQLDAVFIHTPSTTRNDVLNNICQGRAFGVHFPRIAEPTWEQKRLAAEQVSRPQHISVNQDTLKVAWQQTMAIISFIGDGGKLLAQAENTRQASYAIQPEDTYVRVMLTSPEGLLYVLNPIVRSQDGDMPPKQWLAAIHRGKTLGKRLFIGSAALLTLAGITIVYRKIKKRTPKPSA
jgi:hypothetical protein